ncbi:MAG: 30S ribosomal protein S11 [Candidatus Uhrbacteria bacterium]
MDDVVKTDTGTTSETTEAAATPRPRKTSRAKAHGQVPRGHLYIQATYNNTIITATDPKGDVLAWSSSGSCGFRGSRKSTPYAASVAIRELIKKLDGTGLHDVHVFASGIGPGREAAIRAIHANALNIISIKDVTPIPHNGCRPPKPRRI